MYPRYVAVIGLTVVALHSLAAIVVLVVIDTVSALDDVDVVDHAFTVVI